jgi:RNA polymerase sigma-70 factor (ECF subfamily)
MSASPLELAADARPLARAIASLPPDQRAAIALFYLEDLSVAEIAAAMDVPAGTVKTRLMHARARLRAALTGENDNG